MIYIPIYTPDNARKTREMKIEAAKSVFPNSASSQVPPTRGVASSCLVFLRTKEDSAQIRWLNFEFLPNLRSDQPPPSSVLPLSSSSASYSRYVSAIHQLAREHSPSSLKRLLALSTCHQIAIPTANVNLVLKPSRREPASACLGLRCDHAVIHNRSTSAKLLLRLPQQTIVRKRPDVKQYERRSHTHNHGRCIPTSGTS